MCSSGKDAASCRGSCWPVADDSRGPPLLPRTPDDKRHVPEGEPGWGSGLTQPLTLPEPVRQRIRAALDYEEDAAPPPERDAAPPPERDAAPPPERDAAPPPERDAAPPPERDAAAPPERDAAAPPERDAAAPPEHDAAAPEAEVLAGRPASLPRRVPGANNGPEPPAYVAQAAMRPSLVHPRPTEIAAAVPAVTLGAIAAAAGTPSDVAGGPPVAARPAPGAVVPAGPPVVPAQWSPPEQRPDGHDRRGHAGNGAGPPAPSRTPMTRAAMWGYLGEAEALTQPLPAIPAARISKAT